jgi:hypothetical protein
VARQIDQLGQPAGLGPGGGPAQRRDAVVPPPFVVERRRRSIAGLDQEPLFEHALDRPVQRPGAQVQVAAGAYRDVLDDRVAVAVFVRKGQQDVERRRRQRQQGVDVVYSHGGYITPG